MKRIVKQPSNNATTAELDKFWNRKFNITSFLFNEQLAFVQDPAPFKTAVCSRRSGKTIACAADLINTAIQQPNVTALYITLSAANAKKLVWKELKKILVDSKLENYVSVNEQQLSLTFQNNSIIYVSGAQDQSEIEKFRGLPIKKCYIDECQSFRQYIKDLIDDIIEPALLDHAGTLCLIGTPGPVPTGYFYECAQNNEIWSHHSWTFFQNHQLPAVKIDGKTHQQLLERTLKRRGISEDHPSIQREYFGRWAFDSDSLLLKYQPTINDFNDLNPQYKYNYILGIDVGWKDADALAVLAWHEKDPTTYLIEEKVTKKQGLTELVEQIKEIQSRYDIHKMVMDMGGLGKKLGEEMIKRYHLPVEAAEKQRKMENVELLNDALRTGRFKARAKSIFAQDTYKLEIDRDRSTPDRIAVSTSFHSDIIDATLYAFKYSPAYTWEPDKKKLIKGTREWAEAQSSEMWEKELAGFESEKTQKDEYGDYE